MERHPSANHHLVACPGRILKDREAVYPVIRHHLKKLNIHASEALDCPEDWEALRISMGVSRAAGSGKALTKRLKELAALE